MIKKQARIGKFSVVRRPLDLENSSLKSKNLSKILNFSNLAFFF